MEKRPQGRFSFSARSDQPHTDIGLPLLAFGFAWLVKGRAILKEPEDKLMLRKAYTRASPGDV